MEKLFIFIGHRPERNKICLAICENSDPEKNIHGDIKFRKGVIASIAGLSEMISFLNGLDFTGRSPVKICENVRYSETKGGLVSCPASETSDFFIKTVREAIKIASPVTTP